MCEIEDVVEFMNSKEFASGDKSEFAISYAEDKTTGKINSKGYKNIMSLEVHYERVG